MADPSTGDAPDILQRVGLAVRALRSARRLTRRELAEASGLSARFLADLEAGRGNISLRRLDHLARALGIPAQRLLEAPPPPTGTRVALLGLRGAGKTTIGRALADRLGVPFLELDARVEAMAGLNSGQIFEIHGEHYYRRLERETLRALLAEPGSFVLATGGGLVTEPETLALLRAACRTVWLSATPDDHYGRVLRQGDQRPMAGNPHAMEELRALLAARRPLYAQADLTVDTSARSVEATLQAILSRLGGPGERGSAPSTSTPDPGLR